MDAHLPITWITPAATGLATRTLAPRCSATSTAPVDRTCRGIPHMPAPVAALCLLSARAARATSIVSRLIRGAADYADYTDSIRVIRAIRGSDCGVCLAPHRAGLHHPVDFFTERESASFEKENVIPHISVDRDKFAVR